MRANTLKGVDLEVRNPEEPVELTPLTPMKKGGMTASNSDGSDPDVRPTNPPHLAIDLNKKPAKVPKPKLSKPPKPKPTTPARTKSKAGKTTVAAGRPGGRRSAVKRFEPERHSRSR